MAWARSSGAVPGPSPRIVIGALVAQVRSVHWGAATTAVSPPAPGRPERRTGPVRPRSHCAIIPGYPALVSAAHRSGRAWVETHGRRPRSCSGAVVVSWIGVLEPATTVT